MGASTIYKSLKNANWYYRMTFHYQLKGLKDSVAQFTDNTA